MNSWIYCYMLTRHYKRTNIIITGTGQAWLTKGQLEKARAVLWLLSTTWTPKFVTTCEPAYTLDLPYPTAYTNTPIYLIQSLKIIHHSSCLGKPPLRMARKRLENLKTLRNKMTTCKLRCCHPMWPRVN